MDHNHVTREELETVRIRERIKNILIGHIGGCTCDPAYSSRNLDDPACFFHWADVDETVGELLAILDKEGKA